MRKTAAAIAVLALALTTAAVAVAAYTQHANVNFTVHKAGKSTGLVSKLYSTVEPTDQLKSSKTVLITFPAKTKFNLATAKVKRCRVAATSCPKSSQIGTGSGTANIGPYVTTQTQAPLAVKAFVKNASTMLLVVTNKLGAPAIVINAKVQGARLTIAVPQVKLGNTPVIVTALQLKVPSLGSGKNALITSGQCVNKKFLINTKFTYSDGSTETIPSTTACS